MVLSSFSRYIWYIHYGEVVTRTQSGMAGLFGSGSVLRDFWYVRVSNPRKEPKDMNRTFLPSAIIACMGLFLATTVWADIPAPPVNQTIGKFDSSIGNMQAADCRACHDSGIPDRHHGKIGTPVDGTTNYPGSPDSNGNYTCKTCHGTSMPMRVERDCTVCQIGRAHV